MLFLENIRVICKNKKFILMWFLLLGMNAVILYKTSIDEPYHSNAYKEAINWLHKEEEPVLALEKYSMDMFFAQSENLLFSNSLYHEYSFVHTLRSYIAGISQYNIRLSSILGANEKASLFSMWDVDQYKTTKTDKMYSKLLDTKPVVGNYFSLEKFFTFGITDGIIFLVILAVVTFLLLEEKERGLLLLIKTTRNGLFKNFLNKALAILTITMVSSLVFYGETLSIYISVFGCDNLGVPIQSVPGFLLCPFEISILWFLILWFLLKSCMVAAITLIVIFTCYLPIKPAVIYFLNCIFVAVNAFVYYGVNAVSKFGIVKYSNYFSLFNLNDILCDLKFIRLGSKNIYLLEYQMILSAFLILAMIALGFGFYLKYNNTQSFVLMKRWKRIPYTFHTFLNELIRLWVTQRGYAIIIVFVIVTIGFNFRKDQASEMNHNFFKYVQYLNSMEYEESEIWIENKLSEIKKMEEERIRIETLYKEGKISEFVYQKSHEEIGRVLYIKPTIEVLNLQKDYIRYMKDTKGIQCDYVYEPLIRYLFGVDGHSNRFMNGIILALFSVCFILPVFTYDRQFKMDHLLRITKNGAFHIVMVRTLIVFMTLTGFMLVQQGISYVSIRNQFGITGFDSNLQSLTYFKDFPLIISIKEFLLLKLFMDIILILLVGIFLLSLSIRGKDVVHTLLIGIIACVMPVVLGLINFVPGIHLWVSPFFVSNVILIERNVVAIVNTILWGVMFVGAYIVSLKVWRGANGIRN